MKKGLSLILVIAFLIALSNINAEAALISTDTDRKISENLKEKMSQVEDDEEIPVYIWLADIDYDLIEDEIAQVLGESKQSLVAETVEIIKASDIYSDTQYSNLQYALGTDITKNACSNLDEWTLFLEVTRGEQERLAKKTNQYVETYRGMVREAFLEQNGEFIANEIDESKIIFLSQYSPMVICMITKSQIQNLCKNVHVENLSLYEDYDVDDFGGLEISLSAINDTGIRERGILGKYVKIGQIETGRPSTDIADLEESNIIRRGSGSTDHASIVAAIMVGENGIAPSATLYSTSAYYNVATDSDNSGYITAIEYENIEWLVSQGVMVINRSFGGTSDGTYDEFSKWIDYIVSQHNVTFVQAAGNSGSSAYASLQSYNAIVVGGINDMGTTDILDDTYYTATSSKMGINKKPDVVAPAVGFSIPEAYNGATVSGTSFAAPHVTGVVAQMMCTVTAFQFRPDAIKAALMASCDRKTVTGASLSYITNEEGAGVINALNAVNSLSRILIQETYYTTSEASISYDFYPLTTGRKTIVLSWFMNVTRINGNNALLNASLLTDFDLYIYDSQGNLVGYSRSAINNAEYVSFEASSTEIYRIEIVRYSTNSTMERITLAYHR